MDKTKLKELLQLEIDTNRQRMETIQLQMKVLDEQAKLLSDLGEKLKRKVENERFLIDVCERNGLDITNLPYASSQSSTDSQIPIERKATLKKPKTAEKQQTMKSTNLLEKYASPSYAAFPQQERETPNGRPAAQQISSAKSASINKLKPKDSPLPKSRKSLPSMRHAATITLPSEAPILKTKSHVKAPSANSIDTNSKSLLQQTKTSHAPSIPTVIYFPKPAVDKDTPRYGPELNANLSKSFEANGRTGLQSDTPEPKSVMSASITSSAKVKITNPNFEGLSDSLRVASPASNASNGQFQTPLFYSSSQTHTPAKTVEPQVLKETPTVENSSAAKIFKEAETPIPVRSDCIFWMEFIRKNFAGTGQMPKKQKMQARGIIISFLEMKGYNIRNIMMWNEKLKVNDVALPLVLAEECFEFVVDRMQLNKPKYVLDEEDIQQITVDGDAKRRRKDVDYDLDKM